MDQEQQRYQRAHARVEALKGFYVHAAIFVLVNLGLFAINALTAGMALARDENLVVRLHPPASVSSYQLTPSLILTTGAMTW